MIKLAIFDLDGTLYDETSFVESGFRAVAKHLAQEFGIDAEGTFASFKKYFFEQERGKVFDVTLTDLHIAFDEELIKTLIQVYREHEPTIKPFAETIPLLEDLKQQGLKLCLVTDTRHSVQKKKVKALGIEPYFDKIVYTDELGTNKAIPHVFKSLLDEFGVLGEETVMVGDDPNIDFIGAKQLGCGTVRIRFGRLKDVTLDQSHEADLEINSLSELRDVFKETLRVSLSFE